MTLQQQRLKRQLLKQYKRDEIKELYKTAKAFIQKEKKKEQMEVKNKVTHIKKRAEMMGEQKLESLKNKYERQMEQLNLECRKRLQNLNSQRFNDDVNSQLPDWGFSNDDIEDDDISEFNY